MNPSMAALLDNAHTWLKHGSTLLDLGIRLYVAKIFFWAG